MSKWINREPQSNSDTTWYYTTKSNSKNGETKVKPRLPVNKSKEKYVLNQETRKTRSRPDSQLQLTKLQFPIKKTIFSSDRKDTQPQEVEGIEPSASPNEWTSPVPAARPYHDCWCHEETKLLFCPAFKNLLQGNFNIVTTPKCKLWRECVHSMDQGGSWSMYYYSHYRVNANVSPRDQTTPEEQKGKHTGGTN